jgi:AmmeMemoRadiSam system protein B
MDKPRLRPLEAFPLETEDGRVLALRDPSGLSDAIALLPPGAAAVVQLFDGRRDRKDVQLEFLRRHGQMLPSDVLESLISRLDESLLLDSPRFRVHVAEVTAAFRGAAVRPAAHAGRSYPGEPAELRRFLHDCFPDGDGAAGAASPAVRALVAPHIDLHRGGAAYGATYCALTGSDADLYVVFGTDHVGVDHPFTLTRKHYQTPLGEVATDVALVDALAARLGDPSLFADELHHRTEHSIEFQALLLRYVLGEHPFQVLPVLCGSLHRQLQSGRDPADDPRVGHFLDAVAELSASRRVCYIAGADFAHVGPRFGDARPLGSADRERLARADAESLDACARGDALGFWRSVQRDGDGRRICGTAPIYHTLRLAGTNRGEVVAYDQCGADDEGGSLVSIGGVVLR